MSKQAVDMIRTVDPAIEMLLAQADAEGIPTVFSRAAAMAPCPIGEVGKCCKNCHMGPCRLVKPGQRGVCGATLETVAARNLARAIAAGAAAHSDHGLDMALTLEAVAKGEAPGYEVRDPAKLRSVAQVMGIKVDGRAVNDLALDVAERAIGELRPDARGADLCEPGPGPPPADLAVARHRPAQRHPRDRGDAAPHAYRHRPGPGAHPAPRAAHRALRRLGRQHAGHRHLGYPLRHPQPDGRAREPGRARRGQGQHRHPRPRADAVGDDRRSRPGSGADRVRPDEGRARDQPVRHLLHRQRDPDAPGGRRGRQLPQPGAGADHRRGGGDGGGRAVHHAGVGGSLGPLPHPAHHHVAQGGHHRGHARRIRRASRTRDRRGRSCAWPWTTTPAATAII